MTYGEYGVTRLGRLAGTLRVSQDGLMTVLDCDCERVGEEIYRLAAVCGGEYVPIGVMMPDGARLRFSKRLTKNAVRELLPNEPDAFEIILPGENPAAAPSDDRGQPVDMPPKSEPRDMPRLTVNPITPTTSAPRAELKWLLDGDRRFRPIQSGGETLNNRELDSRHSPSPKSDLTHGCETPIMPEAKKPADTLPRSEAPAIPESPAPRGFWAPIGDPAILFRDNDAELITGEVTGALTRNDGDIMLLAIPISQDTPFPMMPVFCFGDPEVIDGREYVVFKIKNGLLTA
jgi:hypothetical protein